MGLRRRRRLRLTGIPALRGLPDPVGGRHHCSAQSRGGDGGPAPAPPPAPPPHSGHFRCPAPTIETRARGPGGLRFVRVRAGGLCLARWDVGCPFARSARVTECLWVVPRTCWCCSVVVGATGGASEAWMSGWRRCSALAFQGH